MVTFSARQIRNIALKRGISTCWVDFLKTEEVAKKVANEAWRRLESKGYPQKDRKQLVQVAPSELWDKTWKVEIFLPSVSPPLYGADGREKDMAGQDLAWSVLRASYSLTDLVTHWSSSQRR